MVMVGNVSINFKKQSAIQTCNGKCGTLCFVALLI